MSVVERAINGVKELIDPTKIPVPPNVDARLRRSKGRRREGDGSRNEAMEFWRGNHYRWVDSQGALQSLPTTTSAYEKKGKPPHVIRQSRNLLFDVVEREVSAALQRIPGYDVSPTSSDPERVSAARLATKVCYYGHDKWHLRRAIEGVVRYAIIQNDGGFAWPYFDNTVGPFMDDGEGGQIGQGEIRVRVFGGGEVSWEPGVDFMDSRYHVLEQARDIDDVMEMEGYVGGNLKADAQNAEGGGERSKQAEKLVLVTEYLERPCAKYPVGRWLTIANNRVIVEERPLPLTDGNGEVVDEPVIHRLTYAMDPDSDRDRALVPQLLDAQRTIDNAVNKQQMWVDLAMNPQLVIWNGGFAKGQKLTNEPGAVYKAFGQGKVEWRPVPAMPADLSEIKAEARQDIASISAQNDIPQNVDTARGIQALLDNDHARRANFLQNLADFDSRLARHCLYLVQKHYTESRLLRIRGAWGWESISGFRGSQLLGENDVRVLPSSLETLTREQREQRVMAYADRGWIAPQAAMAAIDRGTAEELVRSYEYDIARANLIVQKIKEGPEALFATPDRPDGTPGWMPRKFDNIDVQLSILADWMKSPDYDSCEPGMQEAANVYYDALEQLKAQKQAEQANAQAMMAESQGAANAAKPQGQIPTPQGAQEQLPTTST